jgi:hypothetical protein
VEDAEVVPDGRGGVSKASIKTVPDGSQQTIVNQ